MDDGTNQRRSKRRDTGFRLTLASPPCGWDCPRRSVGCHNAGNCPDYDRFRAECEELKKERDLEAEVNRAVSEAVGRFPGERRV